MFSFQGKKKKRPAGLPRGQGRRVPVGGGKTETRGPPPRRKKLSEFEKNDVFFFQKETGSPFAGARKSRLRGKERKNQCCGGKSPVADTGGKQTGAHWRRGGKGLSEGKEGKERFGRRRGGKGESHWGDRVLTIWKKKRGGRNVFQGKKNR